MPTRLLLTTLLAATFFLGVGGARASGPLDVVYINGIMNTAIEALRSTDAIQQIATRSENHGGAAKRSFSVTNVFNPRGWSFGDELLPPYQDIEELFVLKTAEELYGSDFARILMPHDAPRDIDRAAASRVALFLDDMLPANNTLFDAGLITESDLVATQKATRALVTRINSLEKAIVVAHSQGNLLANLAYARVAANPGFDVVHRLRVINVANTSEFSVNGLDLTHQGDRALAWLDTVPSTGRDWRRTTPSCQNYQACNFRRATPWFMVGEDPPGIETDFGHGFVAPYLSIARDPLRDPHGVAFTLGAERFVDRFEDLLYAAANSFAPVLRVTVVGVGKVTSAPTGIDCGSECEHAFSVGTEVMLFADAEPGSRFLGWSGDCLDTGLSVTPLTMTSDRRCVATFSGGTVNELQLNLMSCQESDGMFTVTLARSGPVGGPDYYGSTVFGGGIGLGRWFSEQSGDMVVSCGGWSLAPIEWATLVSLGGAGGYTDFYKVADLVCYRGEGQAESTTISISGVSEILWVETSTDRQPHIWAPGTPTAWNAGFSNSCP